MSTDYTKSGRLAINFLISKYNNECENQVTFSFVDDSIIPTIFDSTEMKELMTDYLNWIPQHFNNHNCDITQLEKLEITLKADFLNATITDGMNDTREFEYSARTIWKVFGKNEQIIEIAQIELIHKDFLKTGMPEITPNPKSTIIENKKAALIKRIRIEIVVLFLLFLTSLLLPYYSIYELDPYKKIAVIYGYQDKPALYFGASFLAVSLALLSKKPILIHIVNPIAVLLIGVCYILLSLAMAIGGVRIEIGSGYMFSAMLLNALIIRSYIFMQHFYLFNSKEPNTV
jgi:hypothetical protein